MAVDLRPARLAPAIAALAVLGVLLPAPAAQAREADEPDQPEEVGVLASRWGGTDRFLTASLIARSMFQLDGGPAATGERETDTAILTTGEDHPDALAAAYAGGVEAAPILLTGADRLPQPTAARLRRLDVNRVVIVGGEAAVSAAVAEALEADGHAVERVAGADRYRTAAAVAERWGGDGGEVGALEGRRAALLAGGAGFADALAAGPVAAGAGLPLLLTTPEPSPATDAAVDAMAALDVEVVVVVGGEAAVGDAVLEELADRGLEVERWAGGDRAETAERVAGEARDRLGFDAEPALLARGDDFPDALTAGVHAGLERAPLLLTAGPGALGEPAERWLGERCAGIETVRAIGGRRALRSRVLGSAAETVERCHDGVGELGEHARASRGFPAGARTPELADLRAATADDHDRVEWRVAGDRPAWQVTREQDHPTHPQTGEPIDVDGEAFLRVHLTGRGPRWGEGGEEVPDRLRVDGEAVTEVVLVEDFEGMTEWVVGLEQAAPFAPEVRAEPDRFGLDVAHP